MADNLNIRAGGASDPEVATDNVAGAHYQRVKLDWGAEGAAAPATGPTTPALEGTDITGTALPAGGASTRGWLSAIWKALTDRLPTALIGNRLAVDGSGVTQPVSGTVAVSNLPATQPVSGTVAVSNLPATQPVSGTFWQATQPVSGSLAVTNLPATQAISADTLPLPTSAATENTLAAIKAKTDNLDVPLSTRTQPSDTQKVDGSAVTQPVSGTVTANAGAGPWPATDNGGSLTVDTGQLPAALGQQTMAASLPVVLASDQSPLGPAVLIDGFYHTRVYDAKTRTQLGRMELLLTQILATLQEPPQ